MQSYWISYIYFFPSMFECHRWHGGLVVSTVTLKQEGPGIDSSSGCSVPPSFPHFRYISHHCSYVRSISSQHPGPKHWLRSGVGSQAHCGCPLLLRDVFNAETRFYCTLYMWPIKYLLPFKYLIVALCWHLSDFSSPGSSRIAAFPSHTASPTQPQ